MAEWETGARGVKICPECKVPEIITGEHVWLDNGDIVQKRSPESRLAFVESENLDPIFTGIGNIIGVPIERQVLNISSRENRIYLSHILSQDVKELLRSMRPGDAVMEEQCRQLIEASNRGVIILAAVMGYGDYDIRSFRYEGGPGDYAILYVKEPYSVPMVAGSMAGDIGALTGSKMEVGWSEISPDLYEFVSFRAPSDEDLEERLRTEEYSHQPGGIELDRCPTCGGPAMLGGFRWDLDRGTIVNKSTGRRMVLQGSYLLDPIFRELEAELGEAIPRAVVEAQRRFVKAGFISPDEAPEEADMRAQLAIRGLGNLKEIMVARKGARVRMNNISMHLMVVGLIQGLFETAFGKESDVDWELTKDNDLLVEVTSR